MARAFGGQDKTVVWSHLDENEQSKWMDFLLDNNVQFHKRRDGSYEANMRLCNAADASQYTDSRQAGQRQRGASTASGRSGGGGGGAGKAGSRSRRGSDASAASVSQLLRGGGPNPQFDYSAYKKFSTMITSRDSLTPHKKSLAWLMRLVEELYDLRYVRETADIEGDEEEDEEADNATRASSSAFPIFVVEFFSKNYGVRDIVEKWCWNLLYNVERLRKDHLEVEVFARFLEEYYDADDLLFFLYVRFTIQNQLHINFRSRWTELAHGPERQPRTIFLSHRECQLVARTAYGSSTDPLCKRFMQVVERHLVGQRRAKSDTRRIEVTQFLHLAASEYHDLSPADEEAAGGAAGAAQASAAALGAGGSGGAAGGSSAYISSQQEQERLFREAEAQYNSSVAGRGGAGDGAGAGMGATGDGAGAGLGAGASAGADRDARIAQMEAEFRSQLSSAGGGTPASATSASATAAAANGDYGGAASYGGAGASGAAAQADEHAGTSTPVPDRRLLERLSKAMHDANETYLSSIMRSGGSLPAPVFQRIRGEIKNELEKKVDSILAGVIEKNGAGGSPAAVDADRLASMFRSLIRGGGAGAVTVESFCDEVVKSPEVRHDIEPLLALLFTYAASRMAKKEDGGGVTAAS